MRKHILYLFILPLCLIVASCASMATSNPDRISQESIEKIPFNISREKLENILDKATDFAVHEGGVALYYDKQAGHHHLPLAKFAFNKTNQLIGKTWYCRHDCNANILDNLKKRYPANAFAVDIPIPGKDRKMIYGPEERILTNKAEGIKIEIDDDEVVAINWDKPESYYTNR